MKKVTEEHAEADESGEDDQDKRNAAYERKTDGIGQSLGLRYNKDGIHFVPREGIEPYAEPGYWALWERLNQQTAVQRLGSFGTQAHCLLAN